MGEHHAVHRTAVLIFTVTKTDSW